MKEPPLVPRGLLDSDKVARLMRRRVLRESEQRILLARFYDTEQAKDVTSGINCTGYGRLHKYNKPSDRWPAEPIPEQPAAWRLGLDACDMKLAQLFQIAACDYRCWYCFVDRESLSGRSKNVGFVTTDEMVQMYVQEGMPARVVTLTGGQPDIVPEWTLWMMRSLQRYNLADSTYLWQDDNLSCGFSWEYLSPGDREEIKAYRNYGRCCCVKSYTREGFSETTGVHPQFFDRQLELLSRLVHWGVDVYVYLTLTTSSLTNLSKDMSAFLDRLQSTIHPNIPLRVVPLEIKAFTPTSKRLTKNRRACLANQYVALKAWQDEVAKRFSTAELRKPIYEVSIE